MKKLFLLFVIAAQLARAQPVKIIFDTDIAPDYDDVGAMAMLHAFADRGEAELLATISCNTFETTAATLSVLNDYFNRPGMPIGITKGNFPNKKCDQLWAEHINEKFPHSIKSNADAQEAVALYRKILAAQPDQSVTIVSVGFFTNLADVLKSKADSYSNLSGPDLVKKKVKQLVSMAASYGRDGTGGHEFNVVVDAKASQLVFNEWPTPILLSTFDIGEKVYTGIPLIKNQSIQNSPVKEAFTVALQKDANTWGRNSWDQTAVLAAVRGTAPYFNTKKINFQIQDDGKSVPVPGEKYTCLTFNQSPGQVAAAIEELMMHQPIKK